jgi:branched-chain amino acid transport system substrate-binding protein
MKRTILITLTAILILGMALTGCSTTSTPAAQTKTLEIGYLTDLTGFLSVYYIQQEQEVLKTAELINEAGGITIAGQNYTIKMVGEDSASSADGAAAGATRLVFDKKVKYVIGPFGFEAAASTPLFDENKVINVNNYPMFSPGELTKDTPYSFAGGPGAWGESLVIFQALKANFPSVKTVVLVAADDGTVASMEPRHNAVLKSLGFTVLNDGHMLVYPNGLEDLSPLAAKANSLKPDAVLQLNSAPSAATSFVKALRALGNNVPYLFPGSIGAQFLLDALGPTATDIVVEGVTPGSPNNPPWLQKLQAKMGDTPVSGSLANCLIILTEVMKKAKGIDADSIKAAWEATDTCDCLYGTAIFSGDETFGLHHHAVGIPFAVQAIQNGKIIDKGWISTGPIP